MDFNFTKAQLLSCKKAATKFYRAGSMFTAKDYDDVWQDALIEMAFILDKRPTLNGKRLQSFIIWRLIDKYRAATGCRWRQRHGLAAARTWSIQRLEEDARNSPSKWQYLANPVEELWARDWHEKNDDHIYRVQYDEDGKLHTITIDECALTRAIARTLKGTSKDERECVIEYYYEGNSMRMIGEKHGRSESRVSQIIANFKKRLRTAIIAEADE